MVRPLRFLGFHYILSASQSKSGLSKHMASPYQASRIIELRDNIISYSGLLYQCLSNIGVSPFQNSFIYFFILSYYYLFSYTQSLSFYTPVALRISALDVIFDIVQHNQHLGSSDVIVSNSTCSQGLRTWNQELGSFPRTAPDLHFPTYLHTCLQDLGDSCYGLSCVATKRCSNPESWYL